MGMSYFIWSLYTLTWIRSKELSELKALPHKEKTFEQLAIFFKKIDYIMTPYQSEFSGFNDGIMMMYNRNTAVL